MRSSRNYLADIFGGLMGLPKTMCPRTNFLGLLVPKINRPVNTMSLHCYKPVIMNYAIRIGWYFMTGMYCINAGTLCFWDDWFRGPGVPQNWYVDTTFQNVPSPYYVFKFSLLFLIGNQSLWPLLVMWTYTFTEKWFLLQMHEHYGYNAHIGVKLTAICRVTEICVI